MEIKDAEKGDASLIADAILEAIGEELTENLAGDEHTRQEVHDLFMSLAERTDTQYSYLNTRLAVTDEGKPMGVCVSYDGGDLIRLRRQFFKEANKRLGWNISEEEIESLPGETDSEEFYLDTLMTLPEYRGRGVGKALILDASEKAEKAGKPLGLLCDVDNHRARRLYDSVGFIFMNKRPFAGHEMNHLQLTR